MSLAWHNGQPTAPIRVLPAQLLRPPWRVGRRQAFAPWAWTQLETPMIYPMVGGGTTGLGDAASAQSLTITPGQAGAFYQAFSPQDARTKLASIQAQIQNLQDEKARYPYLNVWHVLDNKIATLQAQMTAIQQNVVVQTEGEAATRDWRSIGQTAGMVAIAFGVAATLAVAIKGILR